MLRFFEVRCSQTAVPQGGISISSVEPRADLNNTGYLRSEQDAFSAELLVLRKRFGRAALSLRLILSSGTSSFLLRYPYSTHLQPSSRRSLAPPFPSHSSLITLDRPPTYPRGSLDQRRLFPHHLTLLTLCPNSTSTIVPPPRGSLHRT